MKQVIFKMSLMAAAVALTVSAASAQTYTFTEVNYSGDTFTQLLGINNSNEIAGYHGSGLDAKHPNKGFTLVLPNKFTSENYPNSVQTQVIGINSEGQTSGFYIDSKGDTHGFIYRNSKYLNSDFPGTTFNQLLSYNDLFQAAGYSQDSEGNFHPYVNNNNGPWESIVLPASVSASAQATGANNKGNIVGFYLDSKGNSHGWYLYEGSFVTLNYPDAVQTSALGVNNLEQIVGSYVDTAGNSHGFSWKAGKFTSIDDPKGVGTTIVNGINDNGVIVGFWGNNADGISHGFVGTPETTTTAEEPDTQQ